MTDKEQKKWYEEKWGKNEEPGETPTERPHCDNDSLKNQDKEQIIVNGIDVGGCRHLKNDGIKKPICRSGGCIAIYKSCLCTNNTDCDYKQLARKTQEFEELKKQLMQKDEVNMFFNTPIEGWSSNPCDICESKNNYEQLTQECEQKDKEIKGLHLIIDRLLEASGYDKHISSAEDFEDVYKDMDYKLGLIDELKQECEELKERLDRTEEDLKYQCVDCMNVKSDRYRKALEEIEEYIKKYECDNCEDFVFGCGDCGTPRDILDIISKAKERENE